MPELPEKSYESLDAGQLAADEFFQQWVAQPSPETILFWQNFLLANPEKQPTVDEARRLLQGLDFQIAALPDAKVSALKTRLEKTIGQPLSVRETRVIPLDQSFFRRTRWIAAAVVLVLTTFSFWWYNQQNQLLEYATDFGQVRQILLPDGSAVSLNANSSISFSPDLNTQNVREVWLKGEAFFSVKHTARHTKFRVHSKGVEIDVLGTEFNVSDRHQSTKVVLQSGKVQISAANRSATLQPGDMIEFSSGTQQLTKRRVKTQLYSSWKEKVWLLEGETMHEVAQRIEDNFGVKVVFENQNLPNEKISGTIPTGSLEEVSEILSDLLKANCVFKNNQLIIR